MNETISDTIENVVLYVGEKRGFKEDFRAICEEFKTNFINEQLHINADDNKKIVNEMANLCINEN